MVREISKVLKQARKLPPIERAELIEGLLDSFKIERRKEIDAAWAKEAESRIDAYNAGMIENIPVSKVFEEIERKDLR
jgi:putative addiction module component (TIGR02574 family)